MNQLRGAALQPKAFSAGMLMLVGAALALTQLTSLALGPAASRQLNVSLAVPVVEIEDVSSSLGNQVDAVLGTMATAGPVHANQARDAAPSMSSLARLTAARLTGARLTGGEAVRIPAGTTFVNNSPVAKASEPSVTAGHSGHLNHGRGREAAKVPGATDDLIGRRDGGVSISSGSDEPAGGRD